MLIKKNFFYVLYLLKLKLEIRKEGTDHNVKMNKGHFWGGEGRVCDRFAQQPYARTKHMKQKTILKFICGGFRKTKRISNRTTISYATKYVKSTLMKENPR